MMERTRGLMQEAHTMCQELLPCCLYKAIPATHKGSFLHFPRIQRTWGTCPGPCNWESNPCHQPPLSMLSIHLAAPKAVLPQVLSWKVLRCQKWNTTQTPLSNKGTIFVHVYVKPRGRSSCMGWDRVPTASSESPPKVPISPPAGSNLLQLYTVAMDASSLHLLNC